MEPTHPGQPGYRRYQETEAYALFVDLLRLCADVPKRLPRSALTPELLACAEKLAAGAEVMAPLVKKLRALDQRLLDQAAAN